MRLKVKAPKARVKTALGIDISSTSISLAWIKQDSHGIHLLRAVRRPMPQGLFRGGTLENPKLLRKILCELKRKCGQTRRTTLSLFSSRSLTQIVEIPDDVTINMGPYIQKEIKHYVTLAGIKTVSDYRSLESTEASKRAFVVAGENKCVTSVVNVCQAVGLDVRVVEPCLLAYARALYHKKLANHFGSNVVLGLMRDDQICFAVWRDRGLRFIRTHSLSNVKGDPEQLGDFLVEKLTMIMQYYDVEVSEKTDHWEVSVVADDASSFPEQARTRLREAMGETSLDVITSDNFEAYGSVDIQKSVASDQISIAAVGYAMQILSDDMSLPEINLLPMQIREEKEVKRGAMLTAVAAASILLLMGLLAVGFIVRVNEVNARIASKRPRSAVGEVVRERAEIESKIEQVGKIPTMLRENLGSQKDVNWLGVLSDIKNSRPKGACLTALDTRSNFEVFLMGKALTYSDVTKYVARLGQAAHIDSANLVKSVTDREDGYSNHHVYEIKCQLRTTTGI